jgi:hypothetical protein
MAIKIAYHALGDGKMLFLVKRGGQGELPV